MNNLLLLCLLLLVTGCAVKGDYTCGVPDNGVRCQPMNDTHKQLYDGSLNSLHTEPFQDDEPDDSDEEFTEAYGDDSYMSTPSSTNTGEQTDRMRNLPSIMTIQSKQAILSHPRELRIWFDRFTDPEGDLHDESFVFIRIDNGHWVIDNKPVLY